jgi:hypothetical protein
MSEGDWSSVICTDDSTARPTSRPPPVPLSAQRPSDRSCGVRNHRSVVLPRVDRRLQRTLRAFRQRRGGRCTTRFQDRRSALGDHGDQRLLWTNRFHSPGNLLGSVGLQTPSTRVALPPPGITPTPFMSASFKTAFVDADPNSDWKRCSAASDTMGAAGCRRAERSAFPRSATEVGVLSSKVKTRRLGSGASIEQTARARGDDRDAFGGPTGCPDSRRIRSGLRGERVVWRRRTQEYTYRAGRQAQQGDQRWACRS